MVRKGKKLVLITGKMRAGKTTAARFLESMYGYHTFSIADKLKELHAELTNSTEKDREWLQRVGVGVRHVFGDDFWVNETIKSIDTLITRTGGSVVVDDVRFDNELTRLYSFGLDRFEEVYVLHAMCSEELQLTRGAEKEYLHHESEELARELDSLCDQTNVEGEAVMWRSGAVAVFIETVNGGSQVNQYLRNVDDVVNSSTRLYQAWFDVDE